MRTKKANFDSLVAQKRALIRVDVVQKDDEWVTRLKRLMIHRAGNEEQCDGKKLIGRSRVVTLGKSGRSAG